MLTEFAFSLTSSSLGLRVVLNQLLVAIFSTRIDVQ